MKTKARKIVLPSPMRLWCGEACRRLSLALILMVLCSIGACADSFEVTANGVTWTCTINPYSATEVWIQPATPSNISGTVTLPTMVEYNATEYTVLGPYFAAFSGCSNLTAVNIPEGIKEIKNSAFAGCSGLTTITIPNSVIYIESAAFTNCSNLQSFVFGNGVTNLSSGIFFGCSKLENVTIGTGITSIYSGIFNGTNLSSLKTVKIVEGTDPLIIGYQAFENNTSLTTIFLPNNVTTISTAAFNGCTSLTSVTIPASVTSIGSSAFNGCSSLASVYVMATNPPSLDNNGFMNNAEDRKIYVPSGSVDDYKGATNWSGYVDKIEAISITASGNCGANGNNCTYNLYGNGMLVISGTGAMADYSFGGAPWNNFKASITSVEIGSDVTSIGDYAFMDCVNLSWISFSGSSNLTSIGRNAFYNCSSLTSVSIPNGVTSIGSAAFQYCTALTTISIPNGLESIDYAAFDNTAWKSNLPNGMVYLGNVAYTYKGAMPEDTDLVLKEGTKSIAGGAFESQSNLKSITIPSSVTNIAYGAFSYCSSLTTISVDNDNAIYASVDGVLFNKAKTTLITCPEGKTGSYSIPNSVTNIGYCAFYGCESLTSVTIPNGVTAIGEYAFGGVFDLTSVYVKATTPPTLGDNAFFSLSSFNIVVPSGSVNDYKEATNWSEYATHIQTVSPTASGYCGSPNQTDVSWTFYGDVMDMLVISGTGAIASYTPSEAPWYEHRESITSVEICNGVTTINYGDFTGLQQLESVTIGSGVTSIDAGAFTGCSKLASVNFIEGTSPMTIGPSAFSYCGKIASISLPNNVTTLHSMAFAYCTELNFLNLGNGVTTIENGAFGNCTSLTAVTIPNSVTTLENAFQNCTKLETVVIGNGVTSLPSSIFSGSDHLTSVTVGNGVTNIGSGTFSGKTQLTTVVLGSGVTGIGSGAFWNCTGLTSVTLNSNPMIGEPNFPDNQILTMNLNANTAGDNKWMTFYNNYANFQADENTTVYMAKLNGSSSVTLTEVTDRKVPAGKAVILKTPADVNPVMTSGCTASSVDYDDNELKGVSYTTAQDANKIYYVLSKKDDNFGFYRLKNTIDLGANKAYLAVDAGTGAREFYGFDIDAETTEIVNTDYSDNTDEGDGQIYDLQGRKVQQPVRGIYVKDGRLFIVK